MSQELTDAEWLRRAAVTLTLADKGYAPGHSLPEIVRALHSIAAKLERPAVEGALRDLCNGNFSVLLTGDELRSMLGDEPADDMPVKVTIHPV